jgi:hypothetical protein
MTIWIRILTWLGYLLGGAVILYGGWRFFAQGSVPSLLISLAVIIAGPLEDILKAWVRRMMRIAGEEPAVTLVDLATSVVFLILLLIAIRLV